MAASAVVRDGEWTTYGDISAAVAGSKRAARAVARTAATLEGFPNAHRVLRHDGSVVRGSGRMAREEALTARRRLEDEGVTFDLDGRADPARRVFWDELAARLGREARRGPGA